MNYPKIEDIKSAMFIQPHPDDNEIGAGGLIAYLRSRDSPVYSVTVTKGDGGGGGLSPEAISNVRYKELQKACEILDQQNLGNLGYSNRHPGSVEEIAFDLVKLLRQYRPDAIFSVDVHLENEIHPAHLRVGAAVDLAFFRAGQRAYPFTEDKVQNLLEDTPEKAAFSPRILGKYFTDRDNTIFDITPYYNLKQQAIQAHESQVDEEFLTVLEEYSRFLAMETNYEFVERFKLLYREQTHCFAVPESLKKFLMN